MKKKITMLFVMAGGGKIRKGVYYLEKVLPHIFSKYDFVELLHVGDKFNWRIPKKYKKRINSVGIVAWKEMAHFYKKASFLIHPSLSEGFPNVILEAIANECAVLSSDIQGIEEYLPHLERGYIFKRGNEEELKEGIMFMIENPEQRKQMAKKSKQWSTRLEPEKYYSKLFEYLTKEENEKRVINLLK